MLNASTVLFRGAGYRSFSGGIPEDADHAALASDYAHTTAPLRRLVDRYSGEICVALCADQPVPTWVSVPSTACRSRWLRRNDGPRSTSER